MSPAVSCLFCTRPSTTTLRLRLEGPEGLAERRLGLCPACLAECGIVHGPDLLPELTDGLVRTLDAAQARAYRQDEALHRAIATDGIEAVAAFLADALVEDAPS